ncbi:MAG: hypothetical protein ACTHMT_15965 [Verrucomicrobiota bacterium]
MRIDHTACSYAVLIAIGINVEVKCSLIGDIPKLSEARCLLRALTENAHLQPTWRHQ